MKFLSAYVFFILLFLAGVRIACADQAVSKADALKAIRTFQMEPTSPEGFTAASTIMAFAAKSPLIHISMAVAPWIKDKDASDFDTRNILLAAYVAGNVEAQLKSGRPVDDVYAGWEQVFTTYAQLIHINSAAKIEEVEDLRQKDEHGELQAYAAEVSK
jgi:hypothetical protein